MSVSFANGLTPYWHYAVPICTTRARRRPNGSPRVQYDTPTTLEISKSGPRSNYSTTINSTYSNTRYIFIKTNKTTAARSSISSELNFLDGTESRKSIIRYQYIMRMRRSVPYTNCSIKNTIYCAASKTRPKKI